ncbi:MAG: DNA-processing protein DprA [Acidobacteriota bacterium]
MLSPGRLWPVVRALGGVEATLGSSEGDLASGLKSVERARALLRSPGDREAERWAADVERSGISLVTAFDDAYPTALAEIPDPPFLLFALGNLARLSLPAVAVVGSRGATRYGREVAARLGRDLSLAGVCVVSGFARGVDAEAHAAAREGSGGTIAVLGCGIDVDYPRENSRLKDSLRTGHLILSEHAPGEEPRAANFPIRNRIIAGLCSGVVIVEASRRSGSLITARLAADFGRDVFAVPGSIFSETSIGAHELLRDGAILCRGAEDVLSELFPAIGGPTRPRVSAPGSAVDLSPDARALLRAMGREGSATPDELAEEADLPAATVLAALFELEAAGLARIDGGGRYALLEGPVAP